MNFRVEIFGKNIKNILEYWNFNKFWKKKFFFDFFIFLEIAPLRDNFD